MFKIELILSFTHNVAPPIFSYGWMAPHFCAALEPSQYFAFSLSWSMSFLRSSWFHLLKSSRFSPSLHLRWCFYDLRGDCFLAGLLKWMSDYFPCVSQLKSYSEICVFFNIITTLKYWKITDGLWTLELLYISHWCSGEKNALWERCYCYIRS